MLAELSVVTCANADAENAKKIKNNILNKNLFNLFC
jgi:hypothetical protein